MDLMNAMREELDHRMTLTENGANAYETSGKHLMDFVFAITALRNSNEETIRDGFSKAFFEDPKNAVLALFWIRDGRGGNGERKIFRVCFKWLAENKPEIARATIKLIPEFGRIDDLYCVADTKLCNDAFEIISKQLAEDAENLMRGKPISLASKWAKSENSSSKETRRLARKTMEFMGLTPREYRMTLSKLRNYLDVVERKTSSNRWNQIDYSTVPSQANVKYKDAFMRHDEERRNEYLESLVRGETKINANVLQPHEIVKKYRPRSRGVGWGTVGKSYVNEYDETLEQLWKALPDVTVGNVICCRDGSGSMEWGRNGNIRPLDVASALAIYLSEHNDGVWKDKFITFGHEPQIVSFENCHSLRDKLEVAYRYADCSNTDIEATMMLILDAAVKNHCSQEDMPDAVIIVSDMQFDHGVERADQSLFDSIAERFAAAGYKLPKIVFWNVNEVMGRQNIPMQQNELGVVLVSGYSTQISRMVMSGQTDPYKVLLETINSDRYQPVAQAINGLL